MNQLGPVAKTLLGPELSKGLRNGVPLPGNELFEFVDSEFKIDGEVATFASDLQLDEEKAQRFISEAVQKGLRKAG